MGYQSPSLEDLRKVAVNLERDYQGDNPQRLSFILLLKKLTEKTSSSFPESAKNVLLGAIIFELEIIHAEYTIPWFKRSTVDAKLFEVLNISKNNLLPDDERFVALFALYQHLVMLFTENTMQELKQSNSDLTWRNKDVLVSNVRSKLKELRNRDPQFKQLIHAVPRVGALQKNTEELCENYRKVAKSRNNPDRDRLVNFIAYLHHASDYLYKNEYKSIPEMYELEQNARRGLILFALLSINNTYWMRSPKNSVLFSEGLQALNISHLDDISPAEKSKLLQALSDRIVKVEIANRDDVGLQAYLKEKNVTPIVIDELIVKEIGSYHSEQDKLKHEPRGASAALTSFAGYATQTTAQSAVRRGVGTYAVKGALGMAAVSIAGPMGLVGLGALNCIGSMVGDGIVSSVTASLYAWLIDKLGSSLGAVAAGKITGEYNISDKSINEIRKKLSPEDEKKFCSWVNALLSAPTDVVAEVEKESIRHVFGLEKNALLLPLEQSGQQLANARVLGFHA